MIRPSRHDYERPKISKRISEGGELSGGNTERLKFADMSELRLGNRNKHISAQPLSYDAALADSQSLPVHPMGKRASGAETTHSPAGYLIPRFAVTETLANAIFSVICIVLFGFGCTWFYCTFFMGGR